MTDFLDENGKFKKGVSGNPSGRPKSDKLTQVEKDEVEKAWLAGDIQKAVAILLRGTSSRSELARHLEKFASYVAPKKSSIKTEGTQDIKYIIEFGSADQKPKEINYKDITPNE